MIHELIGRYPAADDREQMGRFLRHAFPLGTESFSGLVGKNGVDERLDERLDERQPTRQRGELSIETKLLAVIH